MEFFQYHDGQIIDEKDVQLFNFMKTHRLFQQEESSRACFTGTINLNDRVYIFLPKGFKAEENERVLKSGRTLLGTLKKYIASGRGKRVSFISEETNISGIPPLEALAVLQDYMRFGLYNNVSSELSKKPSGKVDWGKVIKTHIPFIRKDGSPVYTELITRKTNYFSENDVTSIHKAVLAKLDRVFGWYYSDKSIIPELKKTKLPCSPKKAIAIVSKELGLVYSDRDIRLLKNLRIILSQEGFSLSETEFYSGITNFQHVWEDICSEIYQNDKDKFFGLIPIPAYVYEDGIKPEPANSQVMDVIIEEGKKMAILDAKYYNFANGKPRWSDLVKQFYYKKSMSSVLPDKQIENFFLVPESNSENLPVKAIVVNVNRVPLTDEFEPINIIYLNVAQAMDKYLNKDAGKDYRAELFNKYYLGNITNKDAVNV